MALVGGGGADGGCCGTTRYIGAGTNGRIVFVVGIDTLVVVVKLIVLDIAFEPVVIAPASSSDDGICDPEVTTANDDDGVDTHSLPLSIDLSVGC